MIEELCEKIWSHSEFHSERESLVLSGLMVSINEKSNFENEDSIFRLLESALNFSLSSNNNFKKVAYEIAISVFKIIEVSNNTDLNHSRISSVTNAILNRLGNFPASTFCEKKYLSDTQGMLIPLHLWMANEYHRTENTIEVIDNRSITFTDFQLRLWNSLVTHKTVTINAPTSAGKSFVLQHYVASKYCSQQISISVYLVPTRALIGQVIEDFNQIFLNLEYKPDITEVPYEPLEDSKIIYVLTQERLQILLESISVNIDILIVDEAQNISDGSRGIILQSVVERVKKVSPRVKTLFGSPFTENPEIFHETFDTQSNSSEVINTEESPVLQNLITIDTNLYLPKEVTVSGVLGNKIKRVTKLGFETELVDEKQTLCQIAHRLGDKSINIIFGSEPAKCETLAQILEGIVLESLSPENIDSELMEISKFIEEHIHKDLLLASTIKYGIVYHFGKMPSFLRKAIEVLCLKGKINYIVCTSTLLQGVNLPAQNIFIMNPTKGRNPITRTPNPLTPTEFWNLSGRAGRLTKDFEGNIFLINLGTWITNPLNKPKSQKITPAFSSYICDQTDSLIKFMNDEDVASGIPEFEGIETAFMKLYNSSKIGELESVLSKYKMTIGEKANIIGESLNKLSDNISIPHEVSSKNPNISIYRQQGMFDYIFNRIKSKGPEYVIPPHPLHPYSEIRNQYLRLFKRFHTHFMKLKGSDKSHLYFYNTALFWMKGTSYSELLSKRIAYKNKTRLKGQSNPNTEARGLFDDIETSLRFKYVKYSKCYNDLLEYALFQSDNTKYIKSIPPVYLFLELGACSKTMMSLIGLGVSRTTSSIVAEKAPRTDMDSAEVKNWLSKTSINKFEIPETLKNEIVTLVA